ncbi:PREDICTED: trace amine-associated receptor 7f-like [Acropora digitifera]|uniref:trace amine-associated receptor 7f-like n=1 Tax=Acropora digitifera TaxID=70779 RepID=UPI00077A381B|nr:PREDICTED: trace amine-associated receptor 7f-like [Acropora digitifera]
MDLKIMMNVSEHGNFATLSQIHWVIDRTPSFVLIFSLNIFLAFIATLGNTLIPIALHKVSSIHPPTKCLFSCLAITDFCVGVIVQPLFAASLMEVSSGNWHIFDLTLSCFNFFFCGFSVTTATAISVDRLLALLLGLRYRHTVTLRRVRCLVVCLLLVVIAMSFMYSLSSWGIANSAGFVIIIVPLLFSLVSHGKIFLKMRQHQAQIRRQRVGHEQARPANGGGIPMNIERYKKIVSTIAWVQLALVLCYSPMFIFFGLAMATNWHKRGSFFYVCATTVVYFNSTLNPILYCWKIREVRQAVKTTVKQIRCFLS